MIARESCEGRGSDGPQALCPLCLVLVEQKQLEAVQ